VVTDVGDDDMIFVLRDFLSFSISVHGDPNVQDMCSRFRFDQLAKQPVASKGWSQKAKLVRHTCSRTPGEPPSWRKFSSFSSKSRTHETNTPDPRTMRTEPTSKTETKLPVPVRF
jgi:hypothetical protein